MLHDRSETRPIRVLCLDLDDRCFQELARIVQERTDLRCEAQRRRALLRSPFAAGTAVLVAGCFGLGARAAVTMPPPSQVDAPALAVLPGDSGAMAEAFHLGYADYLTYPFIAKEVELRLVTAAERAHRDRPGRHRFSSDPLVEKACIFLVDNLDYGEGVEVLARHMGTNRNMLSRRFRAALSESPIGWLRKQRMLRAKQLIEETNRPILDIALSVGFEDGNNFSTAFRRTFQHSPRAHRDQCRKQRK